MTSTHLSVATRGAGAGPGRLRFEGVTKTFRSRTDGRGTIAALDGVDFALGPDESVGFIGPNGAGKSTVLRLAAGVSGPSAGRIVRAGRTSTVIELGAGMHPDLTGRENMRLLAALASGGRLGTGHDFDDIIEFSELGDAMDRPVRHYSTGMLARLAFSVAAHSDPELLLIDEVLSVGDLDFQDRCRARINELRSGGTTVVVVSHDLDLIVEMCARAILLINGRIEADGDAETVVRKYLGQPTPTTSTSGLTLRTSTDRVPPGASLEVALDVPSGLGAEAARLEYVVTTQVEGESASMVCGTTTVALPPGGPVHVALSTDGLPRGQYELRATLESSDGTPVRSANAPFFLLGPPGPFAIRLAASAVVDGRRVGDPT